MLAGFQVSAGVASSEVLVPTTDSDDRNAHQAVPHGYTGLEVATQAGFWRLGTCPTSMAP